MSEDILHDYRHRHNLPEYSINTMIYNETLTKIEQILLTQGLSLKCFEGMPQVNRSDDFRASTLIAIEKNYDVNTLKNELLKYVPLLNVDQKLAYDTIKDASVNTLSNNKKVFFIDGPGGNCWDPVSQ